MESYHKQQNVINHPPPSKTDVAASVGLVVEALKGVDTLVIDADAGELAAGVEALVKCGCIDVETDAEGAVIVRRRRAKGAA